MSKRDHKFYDIVDAVHASESEFEGFSDEDGDKNEYALTTNTGENDAAESESDFDSSDDEPLINLVNRIHEQNKKWSFDSERKFVPPNNVTFVDTPVKPKPALKTPYEYFKFFVTDDMISNIVTETNKYATEKNGKAWNFTAKEIEIYIGIYFLMGLVNMPKLDDYWKSELRYSNIADNMGRNRFQKLHSFLHFVDNNLISDTEKADRVWKLRPWLDALCGNFRKVSSPEFQCVDEIMVPFKGRSLVKQYLPKKPHKWGFKLWGRCSSSGFLHDFIVYQGKGAGLEQDQVVDCGVGGNVVLQLCDSLPRHHNYKIFADNYFSNFAMARELKERGYHFTGTINLNRCHKAPLKSDKDLKKEGRGSSSTCFEKKNNLALVRWQDTKCVTLISTYLSEDPVNVVQRYDRSLKEKIEVVCPAIVNSYNSKMGGVDLLDMVCSLYKRQIKGKRWYLYIFYHTLTIALANSWFLYRRDCHLLANEKTIPYKDFQAQVAESMIKVGKPTRGRPPSEDPSRPPPAKKYKVLRKAQDNIRYDNVDHWPTLELTRRRCRHCIGGYSQWKCSKCNIHLCLIAGRDPRNCFTSYHQR